MRHKKQKKNYSGVIISLFIAFIMITSIVGYIFGDTATQTSKFQGHKFTATNRGWRTNIDGETYFFSYLPQDVKDINFSIDKNVFNVNEIDITYEHNSTFKEQMARASFDLANIIAKKGIFLRQGFTENSSYNIPIITCEDASSFVPVIHLEKSNETSISHIDNCIVIRARDENGFLPYSEMLAYKILGIL